MMMCEEEGREEGNTRVRSLDYLGDANIHGRATVGALLQHFQWFETQA